MCSNDQLFCHVVEFKLKAIELSIEVLKEIHECIKNIEEQQDLLELLICAGKLCKLLNCTEETTELFKLVF